MKLLLEIFPVSWVVFKTHLKYWRNYKKKKKEQNLHKTDLSELSSLLNLSFPLLLFTVGLLVLPWWWQNPDNTRIRKILTSFHLSLTNFADKNITSYMSHLQPHVEINRCLRLLKNISCNLITIHNWWLNTKKKYLFWEMEIKCKH